MTPADRLRMQGFHRTQPTRFGQSRLGFQRVGARNESSLFAQDVQAGSSGLFDAPEVPFAARDLFAPSQQPFGKDPRNTMRRMGDAAWQGVVQPRMNWGDLPKIEVDYNPFQSRRDFGIGARWRYEF
jgi:hypothetical protein